MINNKGSLRKLVRNINKSLLSQKTCAMAVFNSHFFFLFMFASFCFAIYFLLSHSHCFRAKSMLSCLFFFFFFLACRFTSIELSWPDRVQMLLCYSKAKMWLSVCFNSVYDVCWTPWCAHRHKIHIGRIKNIYSTTQTFCLSCSIHKLIFYHRRTS